MEIHGFSDASELAYAGVLYLCMTDADGGIHVTIVTAKTCVAPIKRMTIPWLELRGAVVLADLMNHVKQVLCVSSTNNYTWTDSNIILDWLAGNPSRFETFVGNHASHIVDFIPLNRWRPVKGSENPADCASRSLLRSELLTHDLWWNGLDFLSYLGVARLSQHSISWELE